MSGWMRNKWVPAFHLWLVVVLAGPCCVVEPPAYTLAFPSTFLCWRQHQLQREEQTDQKQLKMLQNWDCYWMIGLMQWDQEFGSLQVIRVPKGIMIILPRLLNVQQDKIPLLPISENCHFFVCAGVCYINSVCSHHAAGWGSQSILLLFSADPTQCPTDSDVGLTHFSFWHGQVWALWLGQVASPFWASFSSCGRKEWMSYTWARVYREQILKKWELLSLGTLCSDVICCFWSHLSVDLRLGIELTGDREAYQLSVAVVTHFCKRGGLKQQRLILSRFWRPQFWKQGAVGTLKALGEAMLPASASSQWLQAVLGLWLH